jgi:hypothetical protein
MSDIVKTALARWAPAHYPRQYGSISDDVKSLCDTITALRAEVERLRAALTEIAECPARLIYEDPYSVKNKARAALKEPT